MIARPYTDADYESVKALYQNEALFGGQFDQDRDSRERLAAQSAHDAETILVAEVEGAIVGTVSLITDMRVAWFFRFAAEGEAVEALYQKAVEILKSRGHTQVLVYSPVGDESLDGRYSKLGFTKGNPFTSYFRDI